MSKIWSTTKNHSSGVIVNITFTVMDKLIVMQTKANEVITKLTSKYIFWDKKLRGILKVGLSNVSEDFCRIKFSPVLFNICLFGVLKWKEIDSNNANFVFLENKLICTRHWSSKLMIIYNMLTRKCYFC